MRAVSAVLALALLRAVCARTVTLYNDRVRLDVDGRVVDAHDGCIVPFRGAYFLYGEFYGNLTGGSFSGGGWGIAPQLAVYSSPDLVSWTFRGHLFDASVPANASFTKWIPTAVVKNDTIILWFGSGAWSVATSRDGVSFELVSRYETSRLGGSTDGTGLLLDDDGAGYVAFAALSTGGALGGGHLVSIERLAPDLLSSSKVNVSGFMPLDYTESPALFKRGALYYLLTGSCCCACRGGGGLAVYTAASMLGPWALQPHSDINCAADVPICGGFGARQVDRADLIYNAQWWSVSRIPTAGGGEAFLLSGRRWLSGAGNNASCDDMCDNDGRPMTPVCLVSPAHHACARVHPPPACCGIFRRQLVPLPSPSSASTTTTSCAATSTSCTRLSSPPTDPSSRCTRCRASRLTFRDAW